jgi:hypothetical protein
MMPKRFKTTIDQRLPFLAAVTAFEVVLTTRADEPEKPCSCS